MAKEIEEAMSVFGEVIDYFNNHIIPEYAGYHIAGATVMCNQFGRNVYHWIYKTNEEAK